MTAMRPFVAGNWKMNGLRASAREAAKVAESIAAQPPACDVMLCPPSLLIRDFVEQFRAGGLLIGGQDCHAAVSGANTGDISAEMLDDAGASAVIVGHSERRADHGELDADVRAKAVAAHRAGLIAIICVGETAGQRRAGLTLQVVERQLQQSMPERSSPLNTVIAYEPVWAIGTGLTATTDDVATVHAFIRKWLSARSADAAGTRIVYGGSVKPANARELVRVPHVDGALVGGASLKADDFLGIIAAYRS
jgi:triosephosphate isomerase (TIM)